MKTFEEDAHIMTARHALEVAWRDTLTEPQRDLWRDRWDTAPPMDIAGRTYVTSEPTAWGQVQVPEPVAFAWQQLYGVYRFGLPILAAPSSDTVPEIVIDSVDASADAFTVALAEAGGAWPGARVIVYATQPYYASRNEPKWLLRPIGIFSDTDLPANADLIDFYNDRFTMLPGLTLSVRAAIIGPSNEHLPSADIVAAGIA